MKHITSQENPRFKLLRKLGQSHRERQKCGQTVLDGFHLVEAYSSRYGSPLAVWVSETGRSVAEIARYLDGLSHREQVFVLPDSLFAELATVDTPSGIMAQIETPQSLKSPDIKKDSVLLDGIQDPGNLGSILRSAAAAGFRQILLSEDCAQAWAPKTLRAAMGAHFHLEIGEGIDLVAFAKRFDGQVIATAMHADLSLWDAELSGTTAWILGNEGQGVRNELLEAAQQRVIIPMADATESLNVAAAAAICLFESQRQRTIKP